jgi:dipeptidyl aminopeptidase/acylaminoacyl peptidase
MLKSLWVWVTGIALSIFGYTTISNVDVSQATSAPTYQSPISIPYLRTIKFESNGLTIEQKLNDGGTYERFIVSYTSEGNKIYALLTVPKGEMPEGGFQAIVFNHGYIPPKQYSTQSNYVSYVDYLARNGFVVLKIDFRGNGQSEGIASGSYFSSSYTKDAISALKSLQKFEKVNPEKIGFWGHSMSGNLVLRSMLINKEIKAGVIWAGAVYSYADFAKYRIQDNSYSPIQTQPGTLINDPNRDTSQNTSKLRENYQETDFNNQYWSEVSLTKNIKYLEMPLQIHHAINDSVVNIGYSRDLAEILKENNKNFEFYEYDYGNHNIEGGSFNLAMDRTVKFFKNNLK